MTGAGVPIPDEARERAKQAAIRAFNGDELPTAEQVADLVLAEAAALVVAAAFRAVAAEWRAHAAEVHEQADQAVTALRRRTQGRTAMAWEARAAELDRRADRLEREATK